MARIVKSKSSPKKVVAKKLAALKAKSRTNTSKSTRKSSKTTIVHKTHNFYLDGEVVRHEFWKTFCGTGSKPSNYCKGEKLNEPNGEMRNTSKGPEYNFSSKFFKCRFCKVRLSAAKELKTHENNFHNIISYPEADGNFIKEGNFTVQERKLRVSSLDAFPEPTLIFDEVRSDFPWCLKLKLNDGLTKLIVKGKCFHGSLALHTAEALIVSQKELFSLHNKFLVRNN